jgi:hypothetical protein
VVIPPGIGPTSSVVAHFFDRLLVTTLNTITKRSGEVDFVAHRNATFLTDADGTLPLKDFLDEELGMPITTEETIPNGVGGNR